jgi:hypothetical protein
MNSIEKNHKWARLRDWLAKRRKIILIVTGSILFLAVGAGTYIYLSNNTKPTAKSTPETQLPKIVEPPKYYSPLTGSLVEKESDTQQPVTGVMIENHPDARPQSGLKDAGVVFEAICEGGITRFLALYQSEKPQLVGPVRSVRMYYLDWATGFNASISHVGGNDDVLNRLASGNYRNLDQFSYGDAAYWRSSDRYAPHNMYTSFANLDELNKQNGYTSSDYMPFPRTDGKAAEALTATSINVTISSSLFDSAYTYNATSNSYDRFQAGELHTDADGRQISPTTVIGMFINESTISVPVNGSEEQLETIGSGRAVIFQNGTATEATWSKTSESSQITFTDANGLSIPLVRGQTWITAIPNGPGDVIWS